MDRMTCCFTGGRQKCFSSWPDEEIGSIVLKDILQREIERLIVEEEVTCFITGLMPGPDIICATIVRELQNIYHQVTLECAVPYEEQAIRWTVPQRDIYYDLIEDCDKLTQLQTSYTRDCLKKHTRYLVDRSRYVLAVWDGTGRGKTGQLIHEAIKRGRCITAIDSATMEIHQFNNDSGAGDFGY